MNHRAFTIIRSTFYCNWAINQENYEVIDYEIY